MQRIYTMRVATPILSSKIEQRVEYPFIGPHADRYAKKIADDIKKINPDKILCLCMGEHEPEYFFGIFFSEIQDWLLENNKIINLLISNPDGKEVRPNIITEATAGFYQNSRYILINHVKSDINYEETHLLADKVYTSYNHRYRTERGLLVDTLVQHDLLNYGVVTFAYPDMHQWKYHDGTRLKDENEELENFASNHGLPPSFMRGFFDIVSESSIKTEGWFMTEKTIKSIATLKPFISLCSPGYHKFLIDNYGLELYDELFDYSFDSLPDVEDRIQGIVENTIRISALYNEDFRDRMHDILLPKMIRNRQKMINFGLSKEKIIPKSFWFLTKNTEYQLYGDLRGLVYGYLWYWVWKKWIDFDTLQEDLKKLVMERFSILRGDGIYIENKYHELSNTE